MKQIKKTPTDPDFCDLNPDLVRLARVNGFVKKPLELYLTGQLTWTETLETMVLSLTREFQAQQRVLVNACKEPPAAVMIPQPARPCEIYCHDASSMP